VPKCKKVLFAGLILRFLYLRPLLTACSAGLIEYERQCYMRAEKSVRERLRLLQAVSRCGPQPDR
jgi:hypothetical protein